MVHNFITNWTADTGSHYFHHVPIFVIDFLSLFTNWILIDGYSNPIRFILIKLDSFLNLVFSVCKQDKCILLMHLSFPFYLLTYF